jgi:hypothetical protein
MFCTCFEPKSSSAGKLLHIPTRLLTLMQVKHTIPVYTMYTIILCTLSALACSVRKVELLTGYRWGSSDPHIVFTICLCVYLYFKCKVYSYPVMHIKIIFSQQNRKQPSLPSGNNTLVLLTTLYIISLVPLAYLTASISHPILLPAANRFLV